MLGVCVLLQATHTGFGDVTGDSVFKVRGHNVQVLNELNDSELAKYWVSLQHAYSDRQVTPSVCLIGAAINSRLQTEAPVPMQHPCTTLDTYSTPDPNFTSLCAAGVRPAPPSHCAGHAIGVWRRGPAEGLHQHEEPV